MNILVLTSVYPYEKDSNIDTTKIVAYFARSWVALGHNVQVIILSSSFPKFYYSLGNMMKAVILKSNDRFAELPSPIWTQSFSFIDNGVQVINMPMRKYIPHGVYSASHLKKQEIVIEKELERRRFTPDVITGHWINPQLMLVSLLSQHYGCPSGFVFHSDYSQKKIEKYHAQQYIDNIGRIGFRSQSALEAAKKYIRTQKEPFVCSSGIPDEYLEKYSQHGRRTIRDKDFSFIFAGRFIPYKNIEQAIEGVASACEGTNYSFELVGEGPLKDKLQERITEKRIEKHVFITPRVSREELQDKLRNKDIFVMISTNEVFGMVYIEAMLQGCIVIAAKNSGVDGFITDGENGFLCNPGDSKHLKEIIKRITKMSTVERIRMSQSAVDSAKRQTETAVAARYLNAILT